MTTSVSMRAKKSAVTRYKRNLEKLLEETQESKEINTTKTKATIYELQESTKLLTNAVDELSAVLDSLDPSTIQHETELQYIEASLEIVDQAHKVTIALI
ncbi:unnamed protein product [Nippostrongylus brasiliensis]|uniref:Tubulin-specific chaperone A n=1 Tax=Nippostrongylus brasiliensis TaxID=27835 RepID=A0A0N4YMB7_NIPBR|nr:unnamed protein product [Nippostrongylus brasiliensis]